MSADAKGWQDDYDNWHAGRSTWTVHLTKHGSDAVVTREVDYIGAAFVILRSHRSVRWFTRAVFKPVSIDIATRTVIAHFSHLEKDHLDRPRDPARIPR